MPTAEWVFVRGSDCMWVRRSAASAPPELVIQGPGQLRRVGSFSSERELREFENELYSRLLNEGWTLARCATERRSAVH
jgi:hypothetical protein